MKSSTGKLQGKTPMNTEELLRKKRIAWEDKVALVVTFKQMAKLGNREFEACMNIGKRLYEDY